MQFRVMVRYHCVLTRRATATNTDRSKHLLWCRVTETFTLLIGYKVIWCVEKYLSHCKITFKETLITWSSNPSVKFIQSESKSKFHLDLLYKDLYKNVHSMHKSGQHQQEGNMNMPPENVRSGSRGYLCHLDYTACFTNMYIFYNVYCLF